MSFSLFGTKYLRWKIFRFSLFGTKYLCWKIFRFAVKAKSLQWFGFHCTVTEILTNLVHKYYKTHWQYMQPWIISTLVIMLLSAAESHIGCICLTFLQIQMMMMMLCQLGVVVDFSPLYVFKCQISKDDDVVWAGCGGGGRRKQLKHLWPPVSRSALSRLRIHHNLLIFTNIVCISINVDWYIFRLWTDSCRSWCIFIRGQWNSLRRKINNDLRLGWMKLDWAKIWDHYYLLMTSCWSSWR